MVMAQVARCGCCWWKWGQLDEWPLLHVLQQQTSTDETAVPRAVAAIDPRVLERRQEDDFKAAGDQSHPWRKRRPRLQLAFGSTGGGGVWCSSAVWLLEGGLVQMAEVRRGAAEEGPAREA